METGPLLLLLTFISGRACDPPPKKIDTHFPAFFAPKHPPIECALPHHYSRAGQRRTRLGQRSSRWAWGNQGNRHSTLPGRSLLVSHLQLHCS